MTARAPRPRRVDGVPTMRLPVQVTEPLRLPAHWAASWWAPAAAGAGTALLTLLVAVAAAPFAAVIVP